MSDIDIKECEKCEHFFIGDEMGELHNRYPMCEKSQRNVIWNMDKCPKTCDRDFEIFEKERLKEHDKQIRANAIDEFKTDIINKIDFEDKWLFICKSNNADTNIMFSALKTFVENRAEQLKEQR